MDAIIEVVLLGSFYCVMAIGLNFVFGITDILNFAHGEVLMIGAFVAYYSANVLRVSPFLVSPLSMLVTFTLGVGLYKYVFARISYSHMPCLIVSFGLSYFLMTLMRILLGTQYKVITLSYRSVNILGQPVDQTRLLIALIAVSSIVLTHLFLKKTMLGKKIRAVTQSPTGALLVGIDVDQIKLISFAIGFSLTGLGGALMGLLYPIHPYMGALPSTLSFLVVILGGLGNFFGTIVGAFTFAAVQQLTIILLDPSYTYAVAFTFLAFMLIARTQGILGRRFGL